MSTPAGQYFPAKYPDRLYKARAKQHRLLASGALASRVYRNAVIDCLPVALPRTDGGKGLRPTTPEDNFLAGKTGMCSGVWADVLWLRVCENRFNSRGR